MFIEENDVDEELYKQIRSPTKHFDGAMDVDLRLLLTHRCRIYLLLLLILTSQTHALPILASINLGLASTTPSPTDPYRIYRHGSILLANVQPSYSNGGTVQVQRQRNFSQLRRERHRRAMIDRLLLAFDDDANGEFSPDEFYSLALRLNIFPRFHQYLKQTSLLN